MPPPSRFLPAIEWLRDYRREDVGPDLLAGLITAFLLIPQGMAYALIAGLPPQYGLYASLLPVIVYALFGTSRSMAVGPVAITALMVSEALQAAGFSVGTSAYVEAAAALSAIVGVLLTLMGLMRLGGLARYLSQPVLSGFTSAAAVLIMTSQLDSLLAVSVSGGIGGLLELPAALVDVDPAALAVGPVSLVALLLLRARAARWLSALGMKAHGAAILARAAPLGILVGGVAVTWLLTAGGIAVPVVGFVPATLPEPGLPNLEATGWRDLLVPGLLIAGVSYVSSISIARVLAYRRRERISADAEMTALGLANLAAMVSQTLPVAGGFSRSMVSEASGARTPVAALVSTVIVGAALLTLSDLFAWVPSPVLAAIITVAVAPLVDWRGAIATWRYDRGEGLVLAVTFATVLVAGIEFGIAVGVAGALARHLRMEGHPHVAVVGRVPETEHYRNIHRHRVETWPELLLLRIDESLWFANADVLERCLSDAIAERPELRNVVLICSAVNHIDQSGLESLQAASRHLARANVRLHLAEVKGPVMDRLRPTRPENWLSGDIHLSTEQAVRHLTS